MNKILIVEDEEALKAEVSDWLRFEGFEVATAKNGAEALEVAQKFSPDLILSDIMMPVMDGRRFLIEFRSRDKKIIPFIFMSALSERDHVRFGMNLGADDYITKPFGKDELLNAVTSRLDKHEQILTKSEEELNSLRSRIITHLPQEIRTPLNNIIGFSSLLTESANKFSQEEIVEMSRIILSGGERLSRLFENYLLYVQLELVQQLKMVLIKDKIVEAIIFDEAYQIAKKYNREDKLLFSCTSVCGLELEENMFRKIISELTDNAFRFSPDDSFVRINGDVTDNHFVLTIEDRGIGFTEDEIAQIGAYMQFGREKLEQLGAGLGLILAKKMTILMNGKFEIRSIKHEETAISCSFPAKFVQN